MLDLLLKHQWRSETQNWLQVTRDLEMWKSSVEYSKVIVCSHFYLYSWCTIDIGIKANKDILRIKEGG